MPQAASSLPNITQFLSGLITNRSPVVTPSQTTVTGAKIHDFSALSDGLNVEVSPNDTLVRRPGWTLFSINQALDTFQFKDLTGNIVLYQDSGVSLKQGTTIVFGYSSGARSPLSAVTRGNFFYVANGVDLRRITNTALTTAVPWGLNAPSTPPVVSLQSLNFFNATTGFATSTDAINGVLEVSDGLNSRSLTITINPAAIHVNVTYTGNQISPNQSFTEVTTQTQTGTAPNTVTTDVVTNTSGYTSTVTGAGISNGLIQYFPSTGLSTLDLDYAYTGAMTLGSLSTIINALNAMTFTAGGGIPASAYKPLQVFLQTSVIAGLYHNPGAPPFPTNVGVALNLTVPANLLPNQIQVNSGLYDITNPQLSLSASIGAAPRLYQYVSPAANVTDLFTGAMQIQIIDGITNPAVNFTFTNQTLQQIAATLLSSHWEAVYTRTGSTGFVTIKTIITSVSQPATQDVVITINSNTLVNNNDLNENFQNWTFLESNDYNQIPQQEVNIAYAVRDTVSGGLSNLSPPVTIGRQQYPARYVVNVTLPTALPATQNFELYRTVDGGSSYLFDQQLLNLTPLSYTATFGTTDAGLNDQLIGPIDEENDPPPPGLRQIVSHTGRMWGIVGDTVYFSGGPDTTNGNGDEAWPPGNNFQFPGSVTDIKSTDSGLIVALSDDLHVITGVDSSSYYAKPWVAGYGISAATAWDIDKQTLYLYTTTQQLQSINLGNGAINEIGHPIGDQLASLFLSTSTSLTFHRSTSNDTALYVSNGGGSGSSIFRFDPAKRAWSTRHQPQSFTTGRVRSLETATGVQTLLNSTTAGVFARNLSLFSDVNIPFPAFATVGVMQLAPLGQVASLNNIAGFFTAVGTLPKISVLLNEIEASADAPFLQLFSPVNDPPDAPASVSIWAKRWYIEQTIQPFRTGTRLINLASVKVDFGTDIVKNELLTLVLRSAI